MHYEKNYIFCFNRITVFSSYKKENSYHLHDDADLILKELKQ